MLDEISEIVQNYRNIELSPPQIKWRQYFSDEFIE